MENLIYRTAVLSDYEQIVEMKTAVKQRIINSGLKIWQMGYPTNELLLEDISFNANGTQPMTDVVIDKEYVDKAFSDTTRKYDLKKYIL